MIRYFQYGFFLIWLFVSILYFQNYIDEKKQKQLIFDSTMVHDYEMAKEFFNSQLRNIYLSYFHSYLIKKTLNSASNGNKESVDLLYTLYIKGYYKYKELLQNIVFYDKYGRELSSVTQIKKDELQLQKIKEIIQKNEFFFEYINRDSQFFIKVDPIEFQGSIVGYVKLAVNVDVFMKQFLSKYSYKIVDSLNQIDKNENPIVFKSINGKTKLFILQTNALKKEFSKLLFDFQFNIFLSGLILFFIFYILYYAFKKEKNLKEEIKLQREFFKKIINTSPNPIFVKNVQGRYLLANDSMVKLFNIEDCNAMLTKTNQELQIEETIYKTLEQEESKALEEKNIVYKESQKIGQKYYKFVHVPIYDFEYPVNEEMILGYAIDITSEIEKKNELTRLNAQLKVDINDEVENRFKINEKFKKIFDNIHNAMFVCKVDKGGKLSEFIDINASGMIFLKRFQQYQNKTPNEIFNAFKFKYNEKFKRFEVKKYSYILKIPHGNENINFQVSCNIIYINNDFHAVIFVQLIDEILQLKREKKENQVLLRNIFKKAKSGIAVIDKEGIFKRFNKSFYETIGVTRSYLNDNDFFSLFDKSLKKHVEKEHKKLFEDEKELSGKYRLTTDKKRIEIIASSTLIEDSNGEAFRLFIFEDITKQKELEIEQYQNSRIIAQQAKMVEMGEMIGAIAHQWRQPLNAINAAAIKLNFTASLDMLNMEEIQEKTKFIEKQSLKMSETINDFMYFFKPSKEKEEFFLSEIYKKIFDFLEPQLKNREITMSLDNPKNISIYGFQNEFEHILLNLINNSKDAFDDMESISQKYINITAYSMNDINVVKVSDNAGGIPEKLLNKVFNPYFTTKEEGKGTGIGLYMTKTIMDKHFHGSIEVTNSDDGAVFTLVLPKENNG